MSLAVSYARAFYQTIAEKKQDKAVVNQALSEIKVFLSLLEQNDSLSQLLVGPVVSSGEKQKIVQLICQKTEAQTVVSQFLQLLAKKNRLGHLKEISHSLNQVMIESEGGELAKVVSADPLTEAETAELRAMFSKKTGKAIEFDTSVDPTLIAGFKVTVQGKTYDGSLKAQVDKLKNKLVFGS